MNGFKIKNIEIKNKVVLAPMAGICNKAFRKLVKEFGCGLVYSEMVSDKGIFYNNDKTIKMLEVEDYEKPVSLQIFGSDIKSMTEAAIFVNNNSNCDIIDINMGCPVNKVAKKSQAGASLLKDPNKIYDIVKSCVENTSKPITVKIRSGWDEDSINAVEVSKKIEKAGASAIAIHPRTRSQLYTGKANWDIIRQVKENVSIPIIGNGDITSYLDAKKMMEETKCDAIMIGRKAIGNPWIFKEILYGLENKEYIKPTLEEKKEVMLKHLMYVKELKGERLSVLEFRLHLGNYLKDFNNSKELKNEFFKITDYNILEESIREI